MAMESDSGESTFTAHVTSRLMTINILDNPVWHALVGPHRLHATGHGAARHYPRDIAPFSGILEPTEQAYADLAAGLPARTEARLFRPKEEPLPSGWDQVGRFPMLQMVATRAPDGDASATSELSSGDAAVMMDLVSVSQPGPFGPRTPLLGRYLGVRDGQRLFAMAGERLRVPGYVELSAICVHPDARGRGYAARLVRRLMRLAFENDEVPFLHVRSDNKPAIDLYHHLGFEIRRELMVLWRRPR
jgi:ribosomal protein S18 acetylase RimI-like enzyme